jgi:hypothetical protein
MTLPSKNWKRHCVYGWKMRQIKMVVTQWCCDERKGRDSKGWIQNYLKSMNIAF